MLHIPFCVEKMLSQIVNCANFWYERTQLSRSVKDKQIANPKQQQVNFAAYWSSHDEKMEHYC